MNKLLVSVLIGLLLSLVETSFFSSMYGIFALMPFVFILAVYLLQHHSISSAVVWLVVHGLVLDITHMGAIPFLTLAYTAAAAVAFISSKRIFSNRSIYGVLACALFSFSSFVFVEVLIVWAMSFGERTFIELFLWNDVKFQYALIILFMPILFSFAKYIRLFLEKSLLVPKTKRTY